MSRSKKKPVSAKKPRKRRPVVVPPSEPPPPVEPLVVVEPGENPQPLRPAEQKFVTEYMLNGFNASRAYLSVHPDVCYAWARVAGSRLLTKPNIRAEVDAMLKDRRRRAGVKAGKVLRAAADVLFADLADCYGEDNQLLPVRQIPVGTRRALQAVKEDDYTETRGTGKKRRTVCRRTRVYRLNSKGPALGYLFKFLALEQDQPAIDVILATLPRPFADMLRGALAKQVGTAGPVVSEVVPLVEGGS